MRIHSLISKGTTNVELKHWLGVFATITLLLVIFPNSATASDSKGKAEQKKSQQIKVANPILSLTNENASGNFWVLAKKGSKKIVYRGNGIQAKIQGYENVSNDTSSIAQLSNGDLALGTANGRSSAVVLYSGTTGAYLSTIPVEAPAVALAASSNGKFVFVLEATKPKRTLFVFDQTHKGFSYLVSSKSIGIASIGTGSNVMILQSDGVLSELSLIPHKIVERVHLKHRSYSVAVSQVNGLIYVLDSAKSSGSKSVFVLKLGGGHALIRVPSRSQACAVSENGEEILLSFSNSKAGVVAIVPI
jgi:hypothetical protein